MRLKKTYESWKRLQESVRPERATGIAYPERLRRAFESAADRNAPDTSDGLKIEMYVD